MLTHISLTIPIQTLKLIDHDRGDIPRSRYVLKLLNTVLMESKNFRSNKKIPVGQSLETTEQQVSIVKGEN
jgi:hypothetical protein